MAGELRRPVALCTRCGATTRDLILINSRCMSRPGGERCKGVYESALDPGDWKLCQDCSGLGCVDGKRCDQCFGDGWRHAPKR